MTSCSVTGEVGRDDWLSTDFDDIYRLLALLDEDEIVDINMD